MRIRNYNRRDIPFLVSARTSMNAYHLQWNDRYYAPADEADREFAVFLRKKLGERNFRILIAEDQDKTVGYLMAWMDRRPPLYRRRKVGYISHVFVEEAWRSRGIGNALYARIEPWFRKNRADFVEISAHAANRRALRLFHSLGLANSVITLSKDLKRS